VDGAVTVYDENGKTMVIVKSKLDVKENSMVIETGDRQNCINHIVDEMKSLGCALTPQTPASYNILIFFERISLRLRI
jgi:hypothetical protein